MRRVFGLLLLVSAGFFAQAQQMEFPVIKEYGGVANFETIEKPTTGGKILMDLTTGSTTKSGINKGWERVARMINLYALAGITTDDLEIVVIVHGEGTRSILTDEAHQAKYGTNNPDLPVIKAVQLAGVDVKVCSQAIVHRGFTIEGVDDSVALTLSAITTLVEYQQKGYAVIYL